MSDHSRGREVWLLLDGLVTDPAAVAALWQATPWPGGIRYRAVVNGLTALERRLLAPGAEQPQRVLEAVVRLMQGEQQVPPQEAAPYAYFLNTVEAIRVTKGSVDMEGVASPVVNHG